MHAKPDLRVVLEWKIYRPDSVIADVIQLNIMKPLEQADNQNSFALSSLMVMVSFVAI